MPQAKRRPTVSTTEQKRGIDTLRGRAGYPPLRSTLSHQTPPFGEASLPQTARSRAPRVPCQRPHMSRPPRGAAAGANGIWGTATVASGVIEHTMADAVGDEYSIRVGLSVAVHHLRRRRCQLPGSRFAGHLHGQRRTATSRRIGSGLLDRAPRSIDNPALPVTTHALSRRADHPMIPLARAWR
jgi:hypothetical protein